MGFLSDAVESSAQSYSSVLAEALASESTAALEAFLIAEEERGASIYPQFDDCFAALRSSSFEDTRVVILGQDPYHGPGQAHGLSFSVPAGVRPPPSLKNIYTELGNDLQLDPPRDFGCLDSWAAQGVLLLNSVLTVSAGQAASHAGKGWEQVTDSIIGGLNAQREGVVFLLWGSYAQKKAAAVDERRHLVLRAPHPSPLSAHRGFLGCGHFSKANDWLREKGAEPIDWLPRQI